jgi:predicted transcriptional regulator
MQSIDEIGDLGKRIEAIGLRWKKLARLAGVSPSTAWRIINGRSDGRLSTIRKLNAALEGEEQRVRRHFAELDGKDGRKSEAA